MFNFGGDTGFWDMSRVERNAHIYEENEKYASRAGHRVAGRIISAFGNLLMVIVIIACLVLAFPRLLGYESYVVVSGSMEPAIPVGSIVYSHTVDPAELEIGDVIVFVDPVRGDTPITHRVVYNDTINGQITTKGDANPGNDIDAVTYDNVMGKVGMHIPYVGYPASIFASPEGKIAAAMMILGAWLLTEIGGRLARDGKPRLKEVKTEQ